MWFYDVLCGFVGFNMMFRWFNMMFIWFYIVFNIFVLYWLGFQITIAIPNDSPDMWWRKPSISCRGLWRFGTTFLFGFSQISFVKFEIPNVGLAWWLYFCHEFCWGARCCSVLQLWIRITLTVFGFCIVWRIPILQLGGFTLFDFHSLRGLLFKHGNWWSSWIISFLWSFDRPRHIQTPLLAFSNTSHRKAPEDLLGTCCREASDLACGCSGFQRRGRHLGPLLIELFALENHKFFDF